MKKKIAAISAAVIVVAAPGIFFALQAAPKNALNSVRAEGLEIADGVLVLPEKYTVIEAEALAGRDDFSRLVIKGAADIGERAFYGCGSLKEVTLEKPCSIGSEAFADCSRLETARISSAEGDCAENAFDGHGGLVIYCRRGSAAEETARRRDISYKLLD